MKEKGRKEEVWYWVGEEDNLLKEDAILRRTEKSFLLTYYWSTSKLDCYLVSLVSCSQVQNKNKN